MVYLASKYEDEQEQLGITSTLPAPLDAMASAQLRAQFLGTIAAASAPSNKRLPEMAKFQRHYSKVRSASAWLDMYTAVA